MKLNEAQKIAQQYIELFRPHCLRVAVGGSVRREKPEVGDIELVVIPDKYHLEMFILGQKFDIRKNGAKYKQLYLPKEAVQLDLFICTPETWGMNFMIRTGSANYTKSFMSELHRRGFTSKDARLYRYDQLSKEAIGEPLSTPEESSVYITTGIPWKEPRERV